MTIKHLKVFLVVAEEKNMSVAAGKLFLSQPTVSQTISEMEKHYGVKLFERYPKTLYLTEAGERLKGYAQHIVASFDRLDQIMAQAAEEKQLRIGASVTVGNCIISELADQLKQEFPNIRTFIRVDNTRVIENQLLQNQLDVAVVEGEIKSTEILTKPVIDDCMVLVCSRFHPFADRRHVSLRELAEEQFILREEGSGTRELFESKMKAEGVPVHVCWECSNLGSIKQALLHNHGLSVLSARLVADELRSGELCVVKIEDCVWKRRFCTAIHKNKHLTEELEVFLELAGCYQDHGNPCPMQGSELLGNQDCVVDCEA
ncbi:LysR family transcriptional regulator [Massilimaliae timonensis]|uniref:LysR family transcriptional regulator n=1 Tax=Massiliimalia timonensis TaxID=1987501 RepID=A0A8J6TYL9_9FIRM|nr:LysR family transcriptional regulator [Massiliimalia timonensis]MBC8610077.1 LysR family transcriptional regulator [Massiliimalia timonensis]